MGASMRYAIALALLLMSAPVFAAVNPDVLPNQAQEARAKELQKQFRCLVCQGQSIDDSNASLAADMRKLIRDRIRAGDSDEQIADYLVQRYGDFVLMKPPLRSDTLLLWAFPFLVLVGGGATAFVILRRAKRANKVS
jgi:cytochrome c-type biogenesis protein CcmH